LNIAIIGAGFAGLATAYELTKHGHTVVAYEAASQGGGLASGFKAEGWAWTMEHFYHHWFASDYAIINLARELGVGDKLYFKAPVTAIYHQGGMYPFDTPLAVLRFPHLGFADKMRTGLVIAYLRLLRNWHSLERTTAHEWLPRWMGRRAYEVVWEPLLIGKFGDDYQQVNMAWFWARIHKRSKRLGYFVGGFQTLADALVERVRQQGGTLRFNTRVEEIAPDAEGGLRVRSANGDETFDRVIATVSPRLLAKLVPVLPSHYLAQLQNLKSYGAVVLILALKRQLLRGVYWLNLPKGEGFPFLALVEHTNFADPQHYGGDHLVYCGDYLPPTHRYFQMTQDELLNLFLPALQRFNPEFEPHWVRTSWLFREPYAQPVAPVNYSQHIPPLQTPLPGLYFASMSQVYPWDRGTNYAVELGQQVAKMIHGNLER